MNNVIDVRDYSMDRKGFSLKSISFSVAKGESFAILGQTGSGKTMLLESIAGYYKDGRGDILINGVPVNEVPTEKRRIGFVYQDYYLFPHMTVFKNIAYGLIMQKKSKAFIKESVEEIADTFSISHILNEYPGTLSGGEKQRTAMARALVTKPDILLLDEPFSALDPNTKKKLYKEFEKIRNEYQCPILFVTHDFEEAKLLADRIGIMHEGRLCAIRTPATLFMPYEDDRVSDFLGI